MLYGVNFDENGKYELLSYQLAKKIVLVLMGTNLLLVNYLKILKNVNE